jgi:hypothetical protein
VTERVERTVRAGKRARDRFDRHSHQNDRIPSSFDRVAHSFEQGVDWFEPGVDRFEQHVRSFDRLSVWGRRHGRWLQRLALERRSSHGSFDRASDRLCRVVHPEDLASESRNLAMKR